MPRTVLVRHALAGARAGPDDDVRPLEPAGQQQARGLVELLEGVLVERVLTSPYARCVQTVEPLCAARGLAAQEHPDLAPDAPVGRVLALLRSAEAAGALVCTHGEVLVALGLSWRSGDPAKGAAWLLEHPLVPGAWPVPAGVRLPGQRRGARQPIAG